MNKTAHTRLKRAPGFTLVELLVVIAIIAILAAVVLIVVNPLELTKRGRDATRLADLTNIQQAINITLQENSSGTNLLCNGSSTPCPGKSNSGSGTFRAIDGTGWVHVNLSAQKAVNLATLPIDPVNDATHYYGYDASANGYKICTVLESDQYTPKMSNDGDSDNAHYGVGTDMSISCP